MARKGQFKKNAKARSIRQRKFNSISQHKKNTAKRNKARRVSGLKVGDKREVDHKKPLSKGGSNLKNNTRIVSRTVNRKKGNK
jgi:5-methylcytosine-specific restriction endonuclease McrA